MDLLLEGPLIMGSKRGNLVNSVSVGMAYPYPINILREAGGPERILAELFKSSRDHFLWACNFVYTRSRAHGVAGQMNMRRVVRSWISTPLAIMLYKRYLQREYAETRGSCVFSFHPISTIASIGWAGCIVATHHGVGSHIGELLRSLPENERRISLRLPTWFWPLAYIERYALAVADAVAVPSEGGKQCLLNDLPPTLASRVALKAVVIPNGLPMPEPAAVIENVAWWRKAILSPSRLIRSKGCDLLLTAFLGLVAESRIPEDVKLVFVGSGPENDKLHRAAGLFLNRRVFFIPSMPRDQLLRAIKESMLVSIVHRETVCDLVLIEAMALGKAILTTDIPGNREMFQNGSGMLVPLDLGGIIRGLSELVLNAQLRAQLGDCARRRWQSEYTETAMAKRYLNAAREIYERRKTE